MELLIKFGICLCLFIIAESGITTALTLRRCFTNCSKGYKPVCGKDLTKELTTFTNICWYNLEKCQNPNSRWDLINENGKCTYEKVNDSDPECLLDYSNCNVVTFNPICGKNENGETREFKNLCLFKNTQCDEKTTESWEIYKSGSCPNSITPPKKYHCPTTCTEEFDPICGQLPDTKEIRIFLNRCFYDRILCQNSEWEILNDQECKKYLIGTNEEEPICGVSNSGQQKNFKNLETFSLKRNVDPNSNWTILNYGKCLRLSTTKCFDKCTKISRPICAIDNEGNQKTFPNLCTFKFNTCLDPSKDWSVYQRGPCYARLKRDTRLPISCFGICSFEYAPFCAISSAGQTRTFINECEHDFEICNNRDCMWKKMHGGPCAQIVSSNSI